VHSKLTDTAPALDLSVIINVSILSVPFNAEQSQMAVILRHSENGCNQFPPVDLRPIHEQMGALDVLFFEWLALRKLFRGQFGARRGALQCEAGAFLCRNCQGSFLGR